jgi:carbon-monoxide dehydrogenase small subunit
VKPRRVLADVLRDDLGLTGTNLGCEHGVCGSCTVLVDGEPARSCLVLAVCRCTGYEGIRRAAVQAAGRDPGPV